MEKQDRNLEALKQRIVVAHGEAGFSPELIQAIAGHCRNRRKEGRTPAYIADELGISEWQVADWSHPKVSGEQQAGREGTQATPFMCEFKVPLTFRFERLLVREMARLMQKCDSCCWKEFVRSLPGGLRRDEEDEQS